MAVVIIPNKLKSLLHVNVCVTFIIKFNYGKPLIEGTIDCLLSMFRLIKWFKSKED